MLEGRLYARPLLIDKCGYCSGVVRVNKYVVQMQIWMHYGWRCVIVNTRIPCKNLQNLASDAKQLYVLLYTTLVGFLIRIRAVGRRKSSERYIDKTATVRMYVNPCMVRQC